MFREAGLLPKERDRDRNWDEEALSMQVGPIYSRSSIDRWKASALCLCPHWFGKGGSSLLNRDEHLEVVVMSAAKMVAEGRGLKRISGLRQ